MLAGIGGRFKMRRLMSACTNSRCTAKYNIHELTYRVKAVFLCFSPSKNRRSPSALGVKINLAIS